MLQGFWMDSSSSCVKSLEFVRFCQSVQRWEQAKSKPDVLVTVTHTHSHTATVLQRSLRTVWKHHRHDPQRHQLHAKLMNYLNMSSSWPSSNPPSYLRKSDQWGASEERHVLTRSWRTCRREMSVTNTDSTRETSRMKSRISRLHWSVSLLLLSRCPSLSIHWFPDENTAQKCSLSGGGGKNGAGGSALRSPAGLKPNTQKHEDTNSTRDSWVKKQPFTNVFVSWACLSSNIFSIQSTGDLS